MPIITNEQNQQLRDIVAFFDDNYFSSVMATIYNGNGLAGSQLEIMKKVGTERGYTQLLELVEQIEKQGT